MILLRLNCVSFEIIEWLSEKQLRLFVDKDGVILVEGGLENAPSSFEQKNPNTQYQAWLLTKNNSVTITVISRYANCICNDSQSFSKTSAVIYQALTWILKSLGTITFVYI